MNLTLFATNATSDTALKMSSLEIAELVKSRHDDVKRSIERLVGKGAISLPPMAEVKVQRERRAEVVQVYTFSGHQGRLDSITVVAQLDPLFTAALVKRWDDLETGKAQPALAPQASAASIPQSTDTFAALFGVAKLIGCDTNAAAISANQAVAQLTGTNLLQLLGQTHLSAQRQDTQWFTPTELGKRHHTSARTFNLLLAEAGMQLKRGDHWEVTEAGREFARIYDTGKKHGSGAAITQIKWSPLVLPLLQLDPAVSIELPEGDGYAAQA